MSDETDVTGPEASDGPGSDDAAAVGIAELAEQELAALAELPLSGHAAAYTRVHEALQRELAAIDSA